MARKQTETQKAVVGRVMHEFKRGKLESSSGDKVRNPKQAIAIALSESGTSNQQSPKQNRRSLQRNAPAVNTKAALYERARKKGVPGRSRMSKEELERAVA